MLPEADGNESIWVTSTHSAAYFPGAIDDGSFEGEVYHSTDGGQNWARLNLPGEAPALALGFDPTAGGRVLVGSDGAVYATTDSGATWQTVGAGIPPGVWVTSLALAATGTGESAHAAPGVFVLGDEPRGRLSSRAPSGALATSPFGDCS